MWRGLGRRFRRRMWWALASWCRAPAFRCKTAVRISLRYQDIRTRSGLTSVLITRSSRALLPRRRTGDELRGDGWPDAAPGPRAGGGAHRRPRAEPADGLRRPAVPLGAGHAG